MSLPARRQRSRPSATTSALALADRLLRVHLRRRGALSRWVSTPTGRVHVLDVPGTGTLPPVVLLHGLSSSGSDFAPLFDRLRPHVRRVLAPDLPGHGLSDAPANGFTPRHLEAGTLTALDALLDEPVQLFGNSMGGYLAIRYALARPNAVSSLMLASPGGAPSSQDALREILDGFRVDRLADARSFVRRVLARPRWYHEALTFGVRARLRRSSVRSLLRGVSTEDAFAPYELQSLAVPTALVWGQHDEVLPGDHFAFFARHLPASTVVERPPEFGHAPVLDDPHAVARRLLALSHAVQRGLMQPRPDAALSLAI